MNDEQRRDLYRDAETGEGSQERSYEREDERWSRASQLRDWLLILALLAAYTAWWLSVYFLEPGIR